MAPRARSVVAAVAPATVVAPVPQAQVIGTPVTEAPSPAPVAVAPVVSPPAEAAPDPRTQAFLASIPNMLPVLNAKGPDGKYLDTTGEAADKLLRPIALAFNVPNIEEALKAGLRLMLDAQDQARRAALLDTLKGALTGYTPPASLMVLAAQAHEAGVSLSLAYTPAVEAVAASGDKPAVAAVAASVVLVVGGAPRASVASGERSPRAEKGAGLVTKGAGAYLGFHQAPLDTHKAAGKASRVMPNGKTYAEGTNHNATQALAAYMLAHPGLKARMSYTTNDKGKPVAAFDGKRVTSDLLRTHPDLQRD